MATLLESLATGFSGEGARRAALEAALRDGLPHARTESWKYTSLRQLERRGFSPAALPHAAVDPALLAGIPAPRLVFANGRFDAALSDVSGLPEGVRLLTMAEALASDDPREGNVLGRSYERADEVFARLNAALADDGAVLRVAEGVAVEAPVHLVFVGLPAEGDLAWHSRHLVELRRGASATVIEHHLAGGDHAHLGNAIAHCTWPRTPRCDTRACRTNPAAPRSSPAPTPCSRASRATTASTSNSAARSRATSSTCAWKASARSWSPTA